MNIRKSILIAVAGAALTFTGIASASANPWQNHHPRRVEVNHRLERQSFRIDRDVREGKITPRQAYRMHREDRAIRRQERVAASFHGGHLTRAEQYRMNREENGVSRQIYNRAH